MPSADSSEISSCCIVERVGAKHNIIVINMILEKYVHMSYTLCVYRMINVHSFRVVMSGPLSSLVLRQPCLALLLKVLAQIKECFGT